MGELSRRDLLKKSAVAGGVAWATPMLMTGPAWGQTSTDACACGDGAVIYAKYAPGNSQTCQNQCLQPGNKPRLNFGCLVTNGVVTVTDEVKSNKDTAALQFNTSKPLKFAIKSENDCFVVRCTEGFGQLYKWSSSTNAEPYNSTTAIADPGQASSGRPLFKLYTINNPTTSSTPCSTSASGAAAGCYLPVKTVLFDTGGILSQGNDKLNFIEMELCVQNLSKIPCVPIDCSIPGQTQ